MLTLTENLLAVANFMPHGICYLWKPGLVSLHLVSNAIIALSYFSIPFSLVYIVHQRKDLPFNWIFCLFAGFIISCGIGHGMDIWTLWHPDYWLSGYIRAVTALISILTAIALILLIPKILTLPSQKQMEQANHRLIEEIKERKKIEQALRESEERWQLALQGTGDGIFDWNIFTDEAFMSPQLKENLDCADKEIANNLEAWKNLVHPEDMELVEQCIQAHLARKTPKYIAEYRMRCKDGSYSWVLARGMAQWNENGQPIRMVGSHQNINARKQAEAKIEKLNQELEERVRQRTAELETANQLKDDLLIRERQARDAIAIYETIVKNIPIGLSIWHLKDTDKVSDFELVEINPSAAQLLNIDRKGDRGKSMNEFLPNLFGPAHQMVVEAYAEVVISGEAKNFSEVRYQDENSEEQVFSVMAFPLPEECLGIALENINERKRMEQALVESTRQYRLVMNSIKEVIFQIDTKGCWTLLNPAWTDITGFTLVETLQSPVTDYIFEAKTRQHFAQLFQSLISGEQESLQFVFVLATKSGDFRWLEMNAQVNRNKEEEIFSISGTIIDITERKEAEAALKERAKELTQLNRTLLKTTSQLTKRNQELDQFAYVTSHDLKAPLRAIANLSEWIEEDIQEKLDDDTRHQMNLLRGRVHRMENLINGLLQYSRAGRLKAKPDLIDVTQLLGEIIDSLSPPPEFTITIEGEMPTLVTERLPLEQVFSNLINNSIKHHHRQDGNINISVEDLGEYYQFAIADDGPGIAPQYHDKIFVIFQTLEARDKAENTGIGLSIVKKTIEAQGGNIELESQLGEGTTFRFSWPKNSANPSQLTAH